MTETSNPTRQPRSRRRTARCRPAIPRAPRASSAMLARNPGLAACPERPHLRAVAREDVERQIDAIERAIVVAAVLQVVDDLQCGAQRVRGRPGRGALPMHIEHKTSDWHGRKLAVGHQLIPVRVAPLRGVEAEGLEQIQRVPIVHIALGERTPQGRRPGLAGAAGEVFLELIEPRDFLFRGQRRVVGDIVGGADKIVEGQNGAAMLGADQP